LLQFAGSSWKNPRNSGKMAGVCPVYARCVATEAILRLDMRATPLRLQGVRKSLSTANVRRHGCSLKPLIGIRTIMRLNSRFVIL
jgi:hypothetical protein